MSGHEDAQTGGLIGARETGIPGSRRPQQHHDGRPDAAGDGAADRGTGR